MPETPRPAERPLAFRAVRGGLWVAFSSYWMIGFGFAVNIVITRLLAPEAFGVVALASFFAQLFRIGTKLSLGAPFIQHKDSGPTAVSTYVVLESALALAGLLLSLLAAPLLGMRGYTLETVQVMLALSFCAVLETAGGIGSNILEKDLRFGPTSLAHSIAFPVSYAPAVYLAWAGAGAWSLVAQNLVYNLLAFAGVWWAASRVVPRWGGWRIDRHLIAPFFRFGLTVGLGMFAASLLTSVDNLLIGTIAGVTALGFYDRAFRTAQWPSLLLHAIISRTVMNTYARLQGDTARLQRTFSMVVWIIGFLALPISLVVLITAPDLVTLLYGERWLPAVPFLRILVVVAVVRPLWENAGTLFVAIGQPRLTLNYSVVQVIVLAALGWPLTAAYGVIGMCLAVAAASVTGVVLSYVSIGRVLPIRVETATIAPVAAFVLTLAGYVLLNQVTGLTDLPLVARVVVKALYAGGLFFVLAFVLQPRGFLERASYVLRLTRSSGMP